MDLRITWERGSEKADLFRIVHLDYHLPTYSPLCAMGFAELTEDAKNIYSQIMGIHGVERVLFTGYKVVVNKGVVFTWDEVGPRVEQVLQSVANADNVIRGETLQRTE